MVNILVAVGHDSPGTILRSIHTKAKVRAKAKRSKNQRKRSEEKRQTSKDIFAFAFAFALCERALSIAFVNLNAVVEIDVRCE